MSFMPRRLARFATPDALGGIVGFAAAYAPSLLPRTWHFQGLVAGLGAMFGNRTGALIRVTTKMPHTKNRVAAGAAAAACAAALVAIPLRSIHGQKAAARYVGYREPDARWALTSAATAWGVFTLLSLQARGIAWLITTLSDRLTPRLTGRLMARLVATLAVIATILLVLDQIILRSVVGVAGIASNHVDRRTPPHVYQPTSAMHSGSPASTVNWRSLGLQGKRFTCAGPSAARIDEVMAGLPATTTPTREPIRAYASMNHRELDDVIADVIAELDRTDAWSRRALLFITSTGRGNVNEWSASTFEFLMRGDCATISMQYSGLPSVITLLTGRAAPIDASRRMFRALRSRMNSLGVHPRLYLAGESLGAFGSSEIFSRPTDLLSLADGAVWTGCPPFSRLHQTLTRGRDAGSSYVLPIIDAGRHVRFANVSADLCAPGLGAWESPRYVFLQNDTDPVVWWSADSLWRKPPWLREEHDALTPMGRMAWMPFFTFWQVAADMTVCRSIDAGFGHKYHALECVPAWAGVLGLDPAADWSPLIEALCTDVPPVSP